MEYFKINDVREALKTAILSNQNEVDLVSAAVREALKTAILSNHSFFTSNCQYVREALKTAILSNVIRFKRSDLLVREALKTAILSNLKWLNFGYFSKKSAYFSCNNLFEHLKSASLTGLCYLS